MPFKKLNREERLERDADDILKDDRRSQHPDGSGPIPPRQEFYLERQLEKREDREPPSGLHP
jgi:hypothetical protein